MTEVSTQHELEKAIRDGGEIVLAPGVYAPIYVTTPNTTLRSEERWKARVCGGSDPVYGIYCNATSCTVEGVAVIGAGLDGIKVEAGGTVRGCWVQRAKRNGIASHNEPDDTPVTIESNLVEFCGSNVQFDHGIYADGNGIVVRENIVRHNAGFGLHLYDHVANATVERNCIYRQASGRSVILASDGGNVVSRNTFVDWRTAFAILNQQDSDGISGNLICGEMQGDLDESNWLGSVADARFVDERKNVFWLREDSPAIGKGAYEYSDLKTKDRFRSQWYYGWPYQRDIGPIPDLWSNGEAGTVTLEPQPSTI